MSRGGRGRDRAQLNEMMAGLSLEYKKRRAAAPGSLYPEDGGALRPLEVMDSTSYSAENGRSHKTERYELVAEGTPVLRRGESFYLGLQLDRPYQPGQDGLLLVFDFGPKPSVTKGTRAVLQLTEETELKSLPGRWSLVLNQSTGSFITLQVMAPPTCPVGIWRCTVATSLRNVPTAPRREKALSHEFYVLFNPWHKGDPVYMCKEDELQEYVLNDTGKVWMGSYRKPTGRRWVFGQFEDLVLPTAMYLIELSGLQHSERGNPVLLSRALSQVVNADDEDGLMEGRWDGDYADGTSPFAWTGSLPVLERYLSSGGIPVKYGQCWVFSAVLVTICRALGLPCRSTTNYVSAHDTNSTMTVDKFFSTAGDEVEGGADGETFDSCWNFHVWTDVWMARPDLPPGYGGWQVIDATPQEESDGLYRCGPASVEAVRHGKVGFLYDTPFVFAEVNADVCHFAEDQNSVWGFSKLRIDHYHVGRKIVTKAVGVEDDSGDADLWDVTTSYKGDEGSREERLATLNAVKGVEGVELVYDLPEESAHDVTFDLVEMEEVPLGQPFAVVVHIENKSSEPRTIDAVLSASSVYYTGITKALLKKATGTFQVQPGQKETMRITLTAEEYVDKSSDHSLVKIFSMASVKETRQTWSEEDDFTLVKPPLAVHIYGDLRVGGESTATFTFKNPLNLKLTGCTISIQGPGLQRPKIIKMSDVAAGENFEYTERFQAHRAGVTKILGSFASRQLSGIDGAATVVIH